MIFFSCYLAMCFILFIYSLINMGVRLLILGLFPRASFLIREGNAFFSKYPLFDGMGDAYFKDEDYA